MNRRSAILATVLGWIGFSTKAKAASKPDHWPEYHKTCGLLIAPSEGLGNGIKFAKDVIAYEIDSLSLLLPSGKVYRRTSGNLTAMRYMSTPPRELEESVIEVPLKVGFVRKYMAIQRDGYSHVVKFDFIDHEVSK